MTTKIVYVTGCLGFIGYHVAQACLDNGYYVIGVDKKTYAANVQFLPDLIKNSRFKFIESDINDLDMLYDCDYIINTAAETHVDNSIVSSDVFLRSNVNGVHHLLNLIKERHRIKMPKKFIPKSIKSLQLGRAIPLHDAGLPRRTWLHVSDTASAVIKIIEAGVQNEIYNISGNHEEQNIVIAMQIVDMFCENVVDDYSKYLNLDITRPGQDVRYSINDEKLRSLSWRPNAIFEVELAKIVQYYSQTFVW